MEVFSDDIRKVPVIRAFIPLATGVVLCPHTALSITSMILILLLLFCLLLFMNTLRKHRPFIHSALLFLMLVDTGLLLAYEGAESENVAISISEIMIKGEVIGLAYEKTNTLSFPVEVLAAGFEEQVPLNIRRIMVYMRKDSIMPDIHPGEEWLLYGTLSKIRNRGNPGEFDYKEYMKRRGFAYTLFTDTVQSLRLSDSCCKKLKYMPLLARRRIADRWDPADTDSQVLKALTLGEKQSLDTETKSAFSTAGAMHLLAVSGLHIGMIWLILDKVLSLFAWTRILKIMKTVLIVLILWFYAGITGFSESVTRSVTMFSLVSLSSGLGRKSNIFNSLFLSAFILVVLDPDRLYDAGFQLSYVAVFGIVSIQPMFGKLIPQKNKVIKYLFELVSVSIAATISTLPLSLFYFHQFSVYFLLSNLVAIPLVSIILIVFVLASPVLLSTTNPGFFDTILNTLTHFLNTCVHFVSDLPNAVVEDIPMVSSVAMLTLISGLCLLALIRYRRIGFLLTLLSLVSVMFLISGKYWNEQQSVSEIRFFNQKTSLLISSREGLNESVFLLPVDSLDYYTEQYLGHFRQKPFRHRSVVITDLSAEENREVRHKEISEGLWVLVHQEISVLIIAKCDRTVLQKLLEARDFDILYFTRGFPYSKEVFRTIEPGQLCIGDGTLNSRDREFLRTNLERICLLEETGSLSTSDPKLKINR